MFNLVRKSFCILKNNFLFIQPPLFLLLAVLTGITYFAKIRTNILASGCLLLSMLLLTIAIFAGWFYINKLAILDYNPKDKREDVTEKTIKNFKKIFEGIGSKFIDTFIAILIIILISYGAFYGTAKLLVATIGVPEFINNIKELVNITTQDELIKFLNNISNKDKITFTYWVFILNAVASILNYLGLVYFASINFDRCNVFKCFINSIFFIFKNYINSIFIIVFVALLHLILNVVALLIGSSGLGYIIVTLSAISYLNYYLLLVFCYYYEKTKDNSTNGAELIGEN